MRFKQFISESRGRELTIEEAAEWIKTNSTTMLEELRGRGRLLYRGKPGSIKPQIADSRNSVRTSANTSNEYTLMLDSALAWKSFPKRSKSFICTTNSGYAGEYGNVLIVFPPDEAKIACAQAKDFWDAFPLVTHADMHRLSGLNKCIVAALDLAGLDSHQTDANVLRERLRQVTSELIASEGDPDNHFVKMILAAMKRHRVNDMEKLVDKLLDPDENGPQYFYVEEWEDYYTPNSEYWFADEAVFIPLSMKKKLLEILK